MGIRNRQQYLDSLRDDREIHIDGERVKDVTRDPRLSGGAQAIGDLYALQCEPELQDSLSFSLEPGGERFAMSFLEPASVADLQRRGVALKRTADATFGMMGRSPDFMNVGITALASASEVFDHSADGRFFAANVRRHYERARHLDLAATHVQVNPQVDRSKPVHQQAIDIALKVVKETDAGFFVKGARQVATLAQFANDILVMPSVVVNSEPEAADYALAFALPIATQGLKFVSRPSTIPQNAAHFLDHPLSLRFEEGDAVVIFDDVFVPWENTFVYRDAAMCNALYQRTFLGDHYTHQSMLRAQAKSEFMIGLGCYLAKRTHVDVFPNVQTTLAPLLIDLETHKGLVELAVLKAAPTPFGTVAPNRLLLHSAQLFFFERFQKMVEAVRTIAGSGLVGAASYAEFAGEAAQYMTTYFQSEGMDAEYRVRLLRLAADATMSAFSSRQLVYERYYQGDPVRRAAMFYKNYPKEPLYQIIEDALEDMRHRAEKFAPDGPGGPDQA
ncbi:MAG TPA: 4-hydroxyphenylacetate 3-hydroxylase N-terminal domain-containing protein [Bordetella sp.]